MRKLEVNHPQAKEIYEQLHEVYANTTLDEATRITTYEKIQLLEALVLIYEKNETLNDDEIDDLFVKYGPHYKPLFPEHYPMLLENMKEHSNRLKKQGEERKMLNWLFEKDIEKNLEDTVEEFFDVMRKHDIDVFFFRILGFNACRVSIRKRVEKDKDVYDVVLEDEGPYEPHELHESHLREWRDKQEERKAQGYITNQELQFTKSVPERYYEKVEAVMKEVVHLWGRYRTNEVDELSFFVGSGKGRDLHEIQCWYDEKGVHVISS